MAETQNIAEVAVKLSKDIFKHFLWKTHPKHDDNFTCSNESHTSNRGQSKKTHPGDVVFYYDDPYLGKTIYLHTDLKSYKKDSISSTKVREAFKSLCMTIDCARFSEFWRQKYSIDSSEIYDVRGLLFIHNHDHGYSKSFYEAIKKIDLSTLPIDAGTQLHFLGPHDIQRLYSIANDIIRLRMDEELPDKYTFYYPEMVLSKRQGDVWGQAASIEVLTSPYIMIKHGAIGAYSSGYIIYYNAKGECAEEFEYLLDSLSRYQMLDSHEKIKIRVTHANAPDDLKSIFNMAKKKYVKAWGFDPEKEKILDQIEIDRITNIADNYNPGDMGWKE